MPTNVKIRELADASIDEITKSLVRDHYVSANPGYSLCNSQSQAAELKAKYLQKCTRR